MALLIVLAALVSIACGGQDRPRRGPATESPARETADSDPWRAAQVRGVDFRAVGQEPGWLLEIDNERSMRLAYDYAEREATVPVPQPAREEGKTTYQAVGGTNSLAV